MEVQSSELKTQSHNSKGKSELRVRSYGYSIKIIQFLESLPEKRSYWTLSNQLLRSATSIGANIIEAKAASSKRDFIKFFEIALKSANESKYWLGLLRDALHVEGPEISYLVKETDELARMLASSLLTMKNRTKL